MRRLPRPVQVAQVARPVQVATPTPANLVALANYLQTLQR